MKSRKIAIIILLTKLCLLLSEWIIFSDVLEIVGSSYELDYIARREAARNSWKYLQCVHIVTKNIIDFINRVAFLFSCFIRRSEKNRCPDISLSFSCETVFCNAKSYSLVSCIIKNRIFITEIISYFTYDSKRKFVCTEEINLIWSKDSLVDEIFPCWYENSKGLTFFSSFQRVDHLVSFAIIESASDPDTSIGWYYVNSCSHRTMRLCNTSFFARDFREKDTFISQQQPRH